MENIDAFLDGRKLYGDDFNEEQILQWYADEAEGYADLGAKDRSSYRYVYHAWNWYHGYRHLPKSEFAQVMGFGAAYGDELLPLRGAIKRVTIVDPSSSFVSGEVHGIQADYVKPSADGVLPFAEQTFDLITCLGALHHIPNVSVVVGEMARTLKKDAYMILREPIVSMGDWRKPRVGLTKHERGIPLAIFREIVDGAGLAVVHQSLCGFPVIPKLFRAVCPDVYNKALLTRLDAWLSAGFAWNLNYHPRHWFRQLRPTSAFFVLRKR